MLGGSENSPVRPHRDPVSRPPCRSGDCQARSAMTIQNQNSRQTDSLFPGLGSCLRSDLTARKSALKVPAKAFDALRRWDAPKPQRIVVPAREPAVRSDGRVVAYPAGLLGCSFRPMGRKRRARVGEMRNPAFELFFEESFRFGQLRAGGFGA